MARLATKDLNAVLEFALEAHAAEDLPTFRSEVVPRVRRLVPCDSIGYNEVDLENGSVLGVTDPPDKMFAGIEERFLATAHQHPLVARTSAGDLTPNLISDFLAERQFHRLELYNDFYKLLETEDQLAFGLPGEVIVAIALCRSKRSFTERDRAVLELVRPHLASVFTRLRETHQVRSLIDSLESGLEIKGAAVIQLDRFGHVAHLSPAAEELLRAYLGAASFATVDALYNGGITFEGPRGRLRIRALRPHDGDNWPALLIEEQRSVAPGVESLRELGLTAREAQVLRLVARGKRNEQIARELRISPATVRKHLEHIYERLGVKSRAQAIARVLAGS